MTQNNEATLSILMPVFNERATLERAIASVFEADLPLAVQLIIVDDGSTDGSRDILAQGDWPGDTQVHYHDRNLGKGAAVRTGLKHATGDVTAIMDADLEYDPQDLAPLLAPILEGDANAVFGVRAFNGYTSHSLLYVLGNRAVTFACNVLFNVYIADMMTCHKVIRTEVFQKLELRERGFTIEPEITVRLLQQGERIYELPAHYRARQHVEGKKLTSRDGFRVLKTLVRCRLDGGARRATGHPAPAQ